MEGGVEIKFDKAGGYTGLTGVFGRKHGHGFPFITLLAYIKIF